MVEYTRKICPTESTKPGAGFIGLRKTKAAITEPVLVYPRSSANTLWLLAWCFCESLNSGSGVVSDSHLFLWPFSSTWVASPGH